MDKIFKQIIPVIMGVLMLVSLSGCVIFPISPNETNPSLHWCPPLPNCVSTEAVTFFHNIDDFELLKPVEQAWPDIREAVEALSGTEIAHEHEGYLYAKSYSRVFHFLDYLEVLYVPSENKLSIRSSSLLGISDLFANYFRTKSLREKLAAKGVVKL